jgi:hypothetical protein
MLQQGTRVQAKKIFAAKRNHCTTLKTLAKEGTEVLP